MPSKVGGTVAMAEGNNSGLIPISRVAKQVAQQIAQRAAFLVDQAIQEKVRLINVATGHS